MVTYGWPFLLALWLEFCHTFGMSLTSDDVVLIRSSFTVLLGRMQGDTAFADAIYDGLFYAAPEVRPMFSGNMRVQAEKLTAMFVRIVGNLTKPEALAEQIKLLGKSHAGYGVEAAHYAVLKDVIVAVFQREAPDVFDDPTLTAWGKAYDILAAGMLAEKG